MMVRVIAAAIFLWCACLSSVAQSEGCFVLYKAKKDNPLKLHLGLMKIDRTCSDYAIEAILRRRLLACRMVTFTNSECLARHSR